MRCKVLATLLVATMLAGCADLNSIHRVRTIPDQSQPTQPEAMVLTVDAKQRHLLVNPIIKDPLKPAEAVKWRMCAEAAPDAFSAYAASGALEGNKSGGKAGFSGSETAATIERTQTVNLLRESMYRTCERYLSGAIDKTTFIVQAARDQRSMVAVLAVEQLTGAIKGKSTIISGPGTSASIVDGEQAAKLVQQYSDGLDQAKTKMTAAGAALTAADQKGKCVKNESKPDDVVDADWAACVAAKSSKAQADADNKTAQTRLDKMLDIASDLTNKINAGSSAGTIQSEAFAHRVIGDVAIVAVAAAVQEIAKSPGLDEPLMFCVAKLSTETFTDKADPILLTCLGIIENRAAQDLKARPQFSAEKFVADQAGRKLSNYLNNPSGLSERQRRMKIAQTAAQNLGGSSNPIDIVTLAATGESLSKTLMVQMILALETDEKSKTELR